MLKATLWAAIFSLVHITTDAQEWPQFRGPNGNGILESIEHPLEWGNDKNIAWAVSLPGGGLASPIVTGDRVFVVAAVGAPLPVSFSEGVRDMRPKRPESEVKFQVTCLNLKDGSELWQKTLA